MRCDAILRKAEISLVRGPLSAFLRSHQSQITHTHSHTILYCSGNLPMACHFCCCGSKITISFSSPQRMKRLDYRGRPNLSITSETALVKSLISKELEGVRRLCCDLETRLQRSASNTKPRLEPLSSTGRVADQLTWRNAAAPLRFIRFFRFGAVMCRG